MQLNPKSSKVVANCEKCLITFFLFLFLQKSIPKIDITKPSNTTDKSIPIRRSALLDPFVCLFLDPSDLVSLKYLSVEDGAVREILQRIKFSSMIYLMWMFVRCAKIVSVDYRLHVVVRK